MNGMKKKTGRQKQGRKKAALGALGCAALLLLCACQKQPPSSAEAVQIGVTCYNQSDTFIGELVERLKQSRITGIRKKRKSRLPFGMRQDHSGRRPIR